MIDKSFWDREYRKPKHFSLSSVPSEDLVKFTRFLARESGKKYLNVTSYVVDIGCGNGRNLVHLSKEFGIRGVGFDISTEAIKQATRAAKDLPLKFHVASISRVLAVENGKADIVLDMLTSHFLNKTRRKNLLGELTRILKPGGWLFFKGPLLDEDRNAARMLKEYPAMEENTYIHPTLGATEYVWTEKKFREFYSTSFEIIKIEKSHLHMLKGRPFKRRTLIAYLRKLS